jgi:non-homologous end joining protein Ku
VTCPVALYPATTEADTVRFHPINPETNNRIWMKTVDAGTGEEVSRSDLAKGFTVAKDQYVLLDKEDLDAVKLESTRIIDIVPARSIDRLYWDVPYHLVPSGKTGIEAFAVIRACWKSPRRSSIGRRASRRAAKPANDDGKVVDLMDALKKNLKGSGVSASAPSASPKPRPRTARSPVRAGGRPEKGTQLYLPAGWARHLESRIDPVEWLAELEDDSLLTKADIGEILLR